MICSDDSETTEIAARLADGHDVEVWSGSRLVVRLGQKEFRLRREST
jgi:hypothetical protein